MHRKSLEDPFVFTASGAQERRAEAERADIERAAVRQSHLERQSSTQLSAPERVEFWERLHGLRLPADPTHPLLSVIATDTALALDDVRAEQARRRAGRVSA
jgi:hypothetical protein